MAKEYNIKAIVNKDELKLLFECDKTKNKQCNKKNCSEYCNHTTDSRYMKAKQRITKMKCNSKITNEEIITKLEKEIEYYRNKLQYIQEEMILISKPKNTTKYEIITTYADNTLMQTIIKYEQSIE